MSRESSDNNNNLDRYVLSTPETKDERIWWQLKLIERGEWNQYLHLMDSFWRKKEASTTTTANGEANEILTKKAKMPKSILMNLKSQKYFGFAMFFVPFWWCDFLSGSFIDTYLVALEHSLLRCLAAILIGTRIACSTRKFFRIFSGF